jgi:hypothetical protein
LSSCHAQRRHSASVDPRRVQARHPRRAAPGARPGTSAGTGRLRSSARVVSPCQLCPARALALGGRVERSPSGSGCVGDGLVGAVGGEVVQGGQLGSAERSRLSLVEDRERSRATCEGTRDRKFRPSCPSRALGPYDAHPPDARPALRAGRTAPGRQPRRAASNWAPSWPTRPFAASPTAAPPWSANRLVSIGVVSCCGCPVHRPAVQRTCSGG